MAEIVGYIIERTGLRAKVKVDQEKSTLRGLPKYLDCLNSIEASQGLLVEVEMIETDNKKAKIAVWGIPLGALLAGLAFGRGAAMFLEWPLWPTLGVSAIIWFFIGLNFSKAYKKDAIRQGEQPTIVAVVYDETEGGK